MLFNSFSFIAGFLPLTWLAWMAARRLGGLRLGQVTISLASLVFYGMWDVRFLPILLGSITVNFWFGRRILAANRGRREAVAGRWLAGGVGFNLLVLGGFKYAFFIISNLTALWDMPPPFGPLPLPLAISFVTFQKIAYLVDCRRGRVLRHDPLNYLFFVSFFPQLIAGPIVHHRPLIAQMDSEANPLLRDPRAAAAGFFFFAVGLCKKVLLADSLARFASPVFDLARHGVPGGEAAWQASLAYSLQLYFDFSGYSDMAIGLALLFGFRLPVNFASPYQARSFVEFWRRWHMTLSVFLRDYLYIPLGGNRRGAVRRYLNLFVTMLLAGLWHGAGWTFILWGALHGLLLLFNHAWRGLLQRQAVLARAWRAVPGLVPQALTFLGVVAAWVLFRSPDLAAASRMYRALLQPRQGAALAVPQWAAPASLLESFLGARPEAGWLWVALGLGVVWLTPNTARWVAYDPTPNQRWGPRPGMIMGLSAGLLFWLALKWMAIRPPTEFLYFNF